MFNPARLNKRVTLLQLIRGEDDGFGGTTTWTAAATVWCEFLKARVSPSVIADDGAAILITQGMRIRARSDIDKGWRVEYKGHQYEVYDVDRSDPEIYVLTTQEVRA